MGEVKLEDIKPNSFKSKEQTKKIVNKTAEKVTPVVTKGSVVSTKKSLAQKFADTFIREDIDDVKTWLITDIIVPGIKDTILDMLGMMFFGGNGGSYRRGHGRSGYDREHVSYNTYYRSDYGGRSSRREDRGSRRPSNDKVDYRNIILQRRDDADRVVDEMCRRIDQYGQVSIAEMLDLMEISGKYTDNNWGWTSEKDIGIRRVSNGYLIDVAEAELLD